MQLKTKLATFGALGAIGAAAYGVARAIRRRDTPTDVDSLFDASDLDEPIIVTEEVVVITGPGTPDFDVELVPFTGNVR